MRKEIIEFREVGVKDEEFKKFEQGFWEYLEDKKLNEQKKIEELKKEAKEQQK